jgi:endonuclease YncB( thermonuclease family)
MTAFLLALIYLTAADTLSGKVVRIADGDTVTILVGDHQVRICLFGIDAPERGQDYSRKSKEALADLVFEKDVRVVVHDKDRYGSTVGDIYVGDTFVNEKMIKDGWAWNYARYSKSKHYAELEREAREAKRGLWAGKHPMPPWDYRAQERAEKAKAVSGS